MTNTQVWLSTAVEDIPNEVPFPVSIRSAIISPRKRKCGGSRDERHASQRGPSSRSGQFIEVIWIQSVKTLI